MQSVTYPRRSLSWEMPVLVEPIAGRLPDAERALTHASGFTEAAVDGIGHLIVIVAAALFFPLGILAVGVPIAVLVRLVAELLAWLRIL